MPSLHVAGLARRRALIAVLGAGVVLLAGGAGAALAPAAGQAVVRATRVSRRGNGLAAPGTPVPARDLGVRTFLDSRRGFALTTGMALDDVTYPAATVDGGRTWHVDGPALHIPAADAPDVVTQLGAARPDTVFAYGGPGGANSVVVSTDGGRRWYRAYLGGGIVAAVVAGSGRLYAFTGDGRAWASRDGGRTWRLTRMPA